MEENQHEHAREERAAKRVRAFTAPKVEDEQISMESTEEVEDEQTSMESTEEVLCLDECTQITQFCDAMEENKAALVKEGLCTCVDMTGTSEERKQGAESSDVEERGARNWAEMAPDVMAYILALLPLDQLIMEIPFVCKGWKLASEYPLCWEKLDFSDPMLAISGTPRLIERALRFCQGRLLEINASCLRDRHCLNLLACSSPLLQKLYIPESCANDEWATYAAPLMPNLKELDLSLCKTSSRALIEFGKHCTGITKVLWQKGFYLKLLVDDREALAIAQHYPHIQHLELNGNALSAEGLHAIVDNCPALTYLDLEECPNVVRRGTKKLLDLCRARFEYFGEPYDEFLVADEEGDDDDATDDDYWYAYHISSASENEYCISDFEADYVDYYTL